MGTYKEKSESEIRETCEKLWSDRLEVKDQYKSEEEICQMLDSMIPLVDISKLIFLAIVCLDDTAKYIQRRFNTGQRRFIYRQVVKAVGTEKAGFMRGILFKNPRKVTQQKAA